MITRWWGSPSSSSSATLPPTSSSSSSSSSSLKGSRTLSGREIIKIIITHESPTLETQSHPLEVSTCFICYNSKYQKNLIFYKDCCNFEYSNIFIFIFIKVSLLRRNIGWKFDQITFLSLTLGRRFNWNFTFYVVATIEIESRTSKDMGRSTFENNWFVELFICSFVCLFICWIKIYVSFSWKMIMLRIV